MKSVASLKKESLTVGGSPLCAGCPASLGLKLALQALGKNTIVINASGCMTLYVTYPYMPLKTPWIHLAIENAAAGASGIRAALKQRRKKNINVICYAGDGATYDIGFQSLSSAVERGDKFIYICYNNQSFSNTGVQKSGATPEKAYTTTTPKGNPFKRKPLVKIMAAHGMPYTATACVSFPMDYMKKLRKASKINGPSFIDLLCPCPTGWGFHSSRMVEVGKLAVLTGAWPLYEIENGKFKLTYTPAKLLPVERYLSLQYRFKHLDKKEINEIQRKINEEWFLLEKGKYWEAEEY